MPWYGIPLNIYINVCLAIGMLLNRQLAAVVNEIQKILGFSIITAKDFLGRPPPNKLLLGCCQEIDFPVEKIPLNVVPCGPILRPAPSVREADPELAAWLARRPTVFVNLGTLSSYSETDATEMASALRMLFDACGRENELAEVQVLWKLRKDGSYSTESGSTIHTILGREIEADRLRITDWTVPEPLAVLEAGNTICYVHHGGAGSYNDAIR